MGNSSLIAQNYTDEKAQLLYELPKYMTWEWDEQIATLYIGSIGNNEALLATFEKYRRRGYPNGTSISIKKFSSISKISQTHILLVGKDMNLHLKEIKEAADIYNTLVITDNAPFKKYSMINFTLNSQKQFYFEINTDNIEDASITLTGKLENLGGIEIDKRDLISETEKELKGKEKEIKEKDRLVKLKEKELKRKNNELAQKMNEIAKQNKKIETQEAYLSKQKQILQDLQDKALIQQQELNEKTQILAEQSKSIGEQKKNLTKQKMAVRKQKRFLENLNAEVSKQQRKIKVFKSDMARQNLIINAQKNLLYIFIGFFIIVLFLILLIYRAYRKMKFINKELEIKNTKINEQKDEIERQNKYTETINKELEKLSIIAQESRNAISIYDTKGNIEWVNIGFTRLYGYTLQLWIQRKNKNIFLADTNKSIRQILNKCLTTKEAQIYETLITSRSGEEMWVQRTVTPLLNIEHEINKLVFVDSDITEIKRAGQEIRKQHEKITLQTQELVHTNKELEKLSLVASKTDNSVVIFDKKGNIEWANEGFERMLQIKLEDFKKEYGSNLYTASLHPDIKGRVNEAVKSKKSISYNGLTVTKKGSRIWIQTLLTPIFDSEGKLSKIVTIDSDITKIKKAEEEITRQKQAITDSILYARRIQQALLPPTDQLNRILPNNFIIYRPKDIVSGDFYYLKEKKNKIVVIAADSTGHGVPGAFMSMLGIAFLNEILAQEIPPANRILDQLRDKVKISLRQSKKSGSPQDGMDIALAIIDKNNKTIEFAGANNPLLHLHNSRMEQYKGDWMPIGIYVKEKPFSGKSFQYKTGDRIYLFSDGITDQIGGPKKRKFMQKKLRQILTDTASLSIYEQEEFLTKELDTWKENQKQLDDILFIAIEL